MSEGQWVHRRRVLLVEDSPNYYRTIKRWLEEEGYEVILATTLEEGLACVEQRHFHVAVVDLHLKEPAEGRKEGLELLQRIVSNKYLRESTARIVLTAYPDEDSLIESLNDLGVYRYLHKNHYATKLLPALKSAFEEKLSIRFDLDYLHNTMPLIPQIATFIRDHEIEKMNAPLEELIPQVQDLLGKLFNKSDALHIELLNPGLTGASVLRVYSRRDGRLSQPYVVKIARRDKAETEHTRFNENARDYLAGTTITQTNAAFSRDLGALHYTFAQGQNGPLDEFDAYYNNRSIELRPLRDTVARIFQHTCHNWYDSHSKRERWWLPKLYYNAFDLDEQKLIDRISELIPDYTPDQPSLSLGGMPHPFINPIQWLRTNESLLWMNVHLSITHGDLTGRNIMVDQTDGRCLLIDFYRTYESHIMRDFVILETDIKFRLMQPHGTIFAPSMGDFLLLEEALRRFRIPRDPSDENPPLKPNEALLADALQPYVRRAYAVITRLQELAFGMQGTWDMKGSRKEYLVSLLMATLNVVRLRHIQDERKILALMSSALICWELEALMKNVEISDYRDLLQRQPMPTPPPIPRVSIAPEIKPVHRVLAKMLQGDKLMLYIGRKTPPQLPWPSVEKLAHTLIGEIEKRPIPGNYTHRKLFTFFADRRGREELLRRHVEYFEEQSPPPIFYTLAEFPWKAIYTTNQHTYLERALAACEVPFREVVTLKQLMEVTRRPNGIPLFKLYGSLAEAHRRKAPFTVEDFASPERQQTLAALQNGLKSDLVAGRTLLMVYASPNDYDLITQWQREANKRFQVVAVAPDLPEPERELLERTERFGVLQEDPLVTLGILQLLMA